MSNPNYPPTTLVEATALFKEDSTIIHKVVNGSDIEDIEVDDGLTIPTIRKTFKGFEDDKTELLEGFEDALQESVTRSDQQFENFNDTFQAQFAYKRIGDWSTIVGLSVPEVDKLNSWLFTDPTSGEKGWYGPVQSQTFPIIAPVNPAVDGGWALVNGLTTSVGDSRYTVEFDDVYMMIGGFASGGGAKVNFEIGDRCCYGVGFWEVASLPVTSIGNFRALGDVWVDDFGANGFSTTDSLVAINTALAVKGTVRLRAGIYYISDEILIGDDTHFKGSGKYATWIRPNQDFIDLAKNNGGRNIIKNIDAANGAALIYNANRDIVIEDMRFAYGTGDPAFDDKINCLGFSNAKRITVRDCYAANLSQHFIDISGCDDVLVEDNTIVNGYWSQIQVDQAGGLYNIVGSTASQKSNNIKIIHNTLTGGKTSSGAIQIHKKGGDTVLIDGNTVYGNETGIVADDYYSNTYGIDKSNKLKILNNFVDVNGDALNIGKSIYDLTVLDNTLLSATGFAIRLQAGAASGVTYTQNARVTHNNTGGKIYICGLVRSKVTHNDFERSDGEIIINARESQVHSNSHSVNPMHFKDLTLTDARDQTTFDYVWANLKVSENIASNGSGKTYITTSTGFRLLEFLNNSYYSTTNAFDFSASDTKSGFLINDYFRSSMRSSTPSTLPEPLAGQQAFTGGLPCWYNGASWVRADGSAI